VIYLDTGVLVRALLDDQPDHQACHRLIDSDAISSCHALAETFNTLTGFFGVANGVAAELIEGLADEMSFEPISRNDYLKVVREARQRGTQGG
jgi:predicted nucleic acid-binding protein